MRMIRPHLPPPHLLFGTRPIDNSTAIPLLPPPKISAIHSYIKLCCLDDGALSMAEFKTFFSDGILSEPDLEKLFNEIDTHNTA